MYFDVDERKNEQRRSKIRAGKQREQGWLKNKATAWKNWRDHNWLRFKRNSINMCPKSFMIAFGLESQKVYVSDDGTVRAGSEQGRILVGPLD